MPRPPNLPAFDTVGARVAWWRVYRGFKDRRKFAADCGMKYSTLADLESGRSKTSERLHAIAAKLRLRPSYLETDKGEPEVEFPEVAQGVDWPFKSVPPSRVERLNHIELKYAENALAEAMREIESARRKAAK